MLQTLLPRLGWAWSTRILAFIVVFLTSGAVLLTRSRLPPKKGNEANWKDMLPDIRIFFDGSGAFALTTMGVFLIEWAYFIPITYLPSYAAANGVPSNLSYEIISIVNAASCFGRYLPGLVADQIGRFNAMALTVLLCTISVFAFWLPANGSVGLIVTFAAIFGFASGSGISLTPICVGQLCDTREYGRFYATSFMVASFGGLTGIPIAGALLKTGDQGKELGVGGGRWVGLVLFTGGCYVASFFMYAAVRVIKVGWGWKARF